MNPCVPAVNLQRCVEDACVKWCEHAGPVSSACIMLLVDVTVLSYRKGKKKRKSRITSRSKVFFEEK